MFTGFSKRLRACEVQPAEPHSSYLMWPRQVESLPWGLTLGHTVWLLACPPLLGSTQAQGQARAGTQSWFPDDFKHAMKYLEYKSVALTFPSC